MKKDHYQIVCDIHKADIGMKYFTLMKRDKNIKDEYYDLLKEADFNESDIDKTV